MGFGYTAIVEIQKLQVAKGGSKSKPPETVPLEATFPNHSVEIAPELLNLRRTHCLQTTMIT